MHVSCTSQISKCSRVKTLSDRCIKRSKMHWGPVESQRNWARKRLWYVTVWSRCFISASHSHLWATDCVHRVILDAHFWTYGIKYLGMCCSKWGRKKKKKKNSIWCKLGKSSPLECTYTKPKRGCEDCKNQIQIWKVYAIYFLSYFIKSECQSFWKKDRREKLDPLNSATSHLSVPSTARQHISFLCNSKSPLTSTGQQEWPLCSLLCFFHPHPTIVVSGRVENSPTSTVTILRIGDTAFPTACFTIKWKVFRQRELIQEEQEQEEEEVKDRWGQWEK